MNKSNSLIDKEVPMAIAQTLGGAQHVSTVT
jgi:hypothetical protein